MSAYYNEIDPYCAEWLKHLMWEGLIAPGEVDSRSIEDVTPNDLKGFTQCHFFAGIGVWSHSLRLAGWPDDRAVWTGSCPCQPFSSAGKGGGFADERHLWPAWHYLIEQCRPDVVFGEQVASPPGLAWLELVHADLEETGYAVGAFDLCAAGVGAPHIRQRLYFVGHVDGADVQRHDGEQLGAQTGSRHQPDSDDVALASGVSLLGNADSSQLERCRFEQVRSGVSGFWIDAEWLQCSDGRARPVEPGTFPLAYGTSKRFMGRLRAYGNAIVAPLAKEFILAYMSVRN